jgi:hypothetical protein
MGDAKLGSMGAGMLRAVYLSILLVSLAGAKGPALAQSLSFPPPHPVPPVDIGEGDIRSYATSPNYGAQPGRASPTAPESYPPAAVDRVPLSSGATPPIYSEPLPPPPQESTYGASPSGSGVVSSGAVNGIPSSDATPPIYSQPTAPPPLRLLNLGEPLPRDQSRILHQSLIARRRLPMNRPIRGRERHMAQCPARATCRARPRRLAQPGSVARLREYEYWISRAVRS